jgi:hypothetical protein
MSPDPDRMGAIAGPLDTVSDKIRALDAAGYRRADIARFLGKRYQHVRNVLVDDAQSQPAGYTLGRADLSGVNEGPAPYDGGPTDKRYVQPRGGRIWRLVLRPDGSLYLPPEVMDALRLRPGRGVIAEFDGENLTLNDGSAALKALQDLVKGLVPPGVSIVDEFIAERRAEAAREDDDG